MTNKASFFCPSCGEEVIFTHKDDVGTTWSKCTKCGEWTSKPRTVSERPALKPESENLPDVHYSVLKSGEKGVAIDPETLFLCVDRAGKKWCFRLISLMGGWEPLTSRITLRDPEGLLRSSRAKPLRDWVARWHPETWRRVLDLAIGVIQDYEKEWLAEKTPSEPRVDMTEKAEATAENYRLRESAVEVGETFTYTGDRPFNGRVQVVALGRPQSRHVDLEFTCGADKEACDRCILSSNVSRKLTDAKFDPSVFASYFDTDDPRDALKVLVERGLPVLCGGWWKQTRFRGKDERAVTPAIVIDRRGTEGRAWFVHGPKCDLKRAPNWIIVKGWLCHGSKGCIGVLVDEFTTESEVTAPSEEEVGSARRILRQNSDLDSFDLEKSVVWKVAEALKKRSQLKGEEIVKGYVSDLLTAGSPTWVKTPEGEPQLGITSNELGPTTTAKSQREREIMSWLNAGRYHTGRMTEAGLTAGAEQVKDLGWILRKGLLPSMDLSFLVLDNMPVHALDRQIESRRTGVVTLTAMKSTELWARCRLKLLGNPSEPFDEKLHKCTVLKVYDPKLIARFAFAVFTYGATTEERYKPEIQTLTPTDEQLLNAARTILRWNMTEERTYKTTPPLWGLIMELSQKLEDEFGCEDIPLLLRSNPYKLAVVAYPFALLEGYEEPEERHIRLAYEWLRFCTVDIELGEYVAEWRRRHELSDEEYEKISEKLHGQILSEAKLHGGSLEETETYGIIEYVARNTPATRDEVAAHISIEPRWVSEKARFLKGLGILRSDKEGYHFTGKGIRFLRRWLPESHSSSTSPTSPPTQEPKGSTRMSPDEMSPSDQPGDTVGADFSQRDTRRKTVGSRIGREVREVGEVERVAVDDLLKILRTKWPGGYEADFIDWAVKVGGLTKDEAKDLFDSQVEEGKILMDPEGYWRWV